MNINKFTKEVKADYSWYAKGFNPLMFIARLILRPQFRFLLCFRILNNFYCGMAKLLLFPLYIYYSVMQWHYKIELPIKTKLGKGANFSHYGPRTINVASIIGEYVQLAPCVLVGGQRGKGTPHIGDHVFLGYGSKIIGNISIGNYVFVCPNSVVVKNVESNSVTSGIPSKTINMKGKKNVQLYETEYLNNT